MNLADVRLPSGQMTNPISGSHNVQALLEPFEKNKETDREHTSSSI